MKRAFTSPEELEKLVDEYFSKCSATEEQLHLKNGDVRIRRTLPSIVPLSARRETLELMVVEIYRVTRLSSHVCATASSWRPLTPPAMAIPTAV